MRGDEPGLTAKRRAWMEAAGWMVLAWVLLYHGVLLGGHWLRGDNGTQNYPWHAWVASLLDGRAAYTPVPEMALGYPLWVEPQVGLYYPLNTARLPLSPLLTFDLKLALHIVLAMVGMVLLARRQGLSPRGAATAAIAVGCSQFMVLRLTQAPIVLPFAWLPWIVWAFSRACAAADRRWLVVTCGLMALQCLAGQPQIMLPTGLMALLVGAASTPTGWPLARRLGWAVGAYALCGAAMLGLTMVVWMPALAHVATAERHGQSSVAFVTQFGANLREAMVNLVGGLKIALPIEQSAFCGTAALLALVWAATQRGRRWRLWLGLAVLGLLLCWAPGNPLYEVIARLPVLNRFRGPGRYALLYTVAGAMLLGRLHDALPDLTAGQRRVVAGGGAALLALAVAISQAGSGAPTLSAVPLVGLVLALAAVAVGWRSRAEWAQRLLLAGLIVELAALGVPAHRPMSTAEWLAAPEARMYQITSERQADKPGAVVFLDRIATDRSLLYGVPQATCFAGLWLPGLEFGHALLSGQRRLEAFAAWGVRWVWLPRSHAERLGWPVTTSVDDQVLVEVPTPAGGPPSAYAPRQLLPLSAAPMTLGGPEADPARITAVPPEVMPPDYQPGPTALSVVANEPRSIRLAVTSRGGTAAVVTRCWAAGWRATVDGQPRPIGVVNQFLMGVAVPAGDHAVEFTYAPDLDVEARATLLSWLLWAMALTGWVLVPAARARRRDHEPGVGRTGAAGQP